MYKSPDRLQKIKRMVVGNASGTKKRQHFTQEALGICYTLGVSLSYFDSNDSKIRQSGQDFSEARNLPISEGKQKSMLLTDIYTPDLLADLDNNV